MAFENVLLIVIIIGVLLFGAKKLPELARALGGVRQSLKKQNEILFEKYPKKLTKVLNKMNPLLNLKVMITHFDLNATCGSIKNWNE